MKSLLQFNALSIMIALSTICTSLVDSFKKNSKYLVKTFVSRVVGVGFVSAFFGASFCYRLRYKDQVFSFFLEKSLPGLTFPHQKIEWETFQNITLQPLSSKKQGIEKESSQQEKKSDTPWWGLVNAVERIDLYSDTISLKLHPRWEKMVHQQQRGLIPLLPKTEQISLTANNEENLLGKLFCEEVEEKNGWAELLPRDIDKSRGKRIHLSNYRDGLFSLPDLEIGSPLLANNSQIRKNTSQASELKVCDQDRNVQLSDYQAAIEIHPLINRQVEKKAPPAPWLKGNHTEKKEFFSFFPLSFPVISQGKSISRGGKIGWIETLSRFYDELPWKLADQLEGISPTLEEKRNYQMQGGTPLKKGQIVDHLDSIKDYFHDEQASLGDFPLGREKNPLQYQSGIQNKENLVEQIIKKAQFLELKDLPVDLWLDILFPELEEDLLKQTEREVTPLDLESLERQFLESKFLEDISLKEDKNVTDRHLTFFRSKKDISGDSSTTTVEPSRKETRRTRILLLAAKQRSLVYKLTMHLEGKMRQLFYSSGTIPPLSYNLTARDLPSKKDASISRNLDKKEFAVKRALMKWANKKRSLPLSTTFLEEIKKGGPYTADSTETIMTSRQLFELKRCLLSKKARKRYQLKSTLSTSSSFKNNRTDKGLNGLDLAFPSKKMKKQEVQEATPSFHLSREKMQGKSKNGNWTKQGSNDWISPRMMSGYVYPDLTSHEILNIYSRLVAKKLFSCCILPPERIAERATLIDVEVPLPPSIGTLFHTRFTLKSDQGERREGQETFKGYLVKPLPARVLSQQNYLPPSEEVDTLYMGPGITIQKIGDKSNKERGRGVCLSLGISPSYPSKDKAISKWAEDTVGKVKNTPTSAWISHFFGKKRDIRAGNSPGLAIKVRRERNRLPYRLGITEQLSRRFKQSSIQTSSELSPLKLSRLRVSKRWHCQPKWRSKGKKRVFRGKGDRGFMPLPLSGVSYPLAASKKEWSLLIKAQLRRYLYLRNFDDLLPRTEIGERIEKQRKQKQAEREKAKSQPRIPVDWPSILLDSVVEGPLEWPLTQVDSENLSPLMSPTLSLQPFPLENGSRVDQKSPSPFVTKVVRHYRPLTGCPISDQGVSLSFSQSFSQKRHTLAKSKPSFFPSLKEILSFLERPSIGARRYRKVVEAVTPLSWMAIYKPIYLFGVLLLFIDFYNRYGREILFYASQLLGNLGFDSQTVIYQLVGSRAQFRVIKGGSRKFIDVAGIKTLIPELGELVWSLRRGQRYKKGGGIKGILLLGPPGVGKTFLVQALAGEGEVPAIVQSASSFDDDKIGGESASDNLKAMFDRARELAPCILFIDEIDSLGASREGVMTTTVGSQSDVLESIESSDLFSSLSKREQRKGSRKQFSLKEKDRQEYREQDQPFELTTLSKELSGPESDSIAVPVIRSYQAAKKAARKRLGLLMQFLIEMDGLRGLDGVLVIGATNRSQVLDPALTRPGRFDRSLKVGLPGIGKRVEILKMYTRNLGIDSTVVWKYLALRTAGLATADIASALNYSAIKAILQESSHTIETIEYGLEVVSRQSDRFFLPSRGEKGKNEGLEVEKGYDFNLQRRAYYQAGRGVLQTLLPLHPPVAYLSLSLSGKELERTLSQLNPDRGARRIELETLLLGSYGGKAGELLLLCNAKGPLAFGKNQWFDQMSAWQSDLGSSELLRSTFLANDMVDSWYLYSREVPLWRENQIQANWNKKELRYEPFFLSLFPYLAERHENEIIEKTSFQDKKLNFSPPAWWQSQVTKKLIYLDISVKEWFQIYIPNPQQSERNIYWLPADEFYHPADYLRTLLKSKKRKGNKIKDQQNQDSLLPLEKPRSSLQDIQSVKGPIKWNDMPSIKIHLLSQGLITSCFQKAFSLLDARRELLDAFASHLITCKILRQNDMMVLFSKFKANAQLSTQSRENNPS